MKKKLSLFLVAFLAVFASSFAEPVEKDVTYALTEGDTFTSGQTVEVKNGTDVVATITYGEDGGEAFKAAKADKNIEGFTAFTEGNGTNGNKTGGTWYTITPKFDGTIEVAVALNADKAFYILEDGTALADYNGITVSAKYYGTYKFTAKADKSYKIYCAGSKLGFYGFKYNYAVDDDDPTPAETKTIYMRPGVWASDAEASTRYAVYAFNVSTEGNQWFDMTEVKDDEGTFTADIPENYEKIILVRMNGATTENNWDNKWNQTADIDFTQTASNTLFTIDGTSWGEKTTPYTTSEYTGPEAPAQKYTVHPADDMVNGSYEADKNEAAEGDQVLLKVIPNEGYEIDQVSVIDVTGAPIETRQIIGGDYNYSFVMPGGDVYVSATFKEQAGDSYYYQKVTSTADITDGTYLIVYEGDSKHNAVAFNGGLETLDASGNGVAVTITDGAIAASDQLDAAVFTIDATNGTLKAANGNYVGAKSYGNGLAVSEKADDFAHQFSITDGAFVDGITFDGGTVTMRYNYASDQLRFRYYKSGQQAVALYKKVKGEGPQPPVEIKSMAIVGEFLGLEATGESNDPNWDPANGWQMTKEDTNPNIWTLKKEGVVVEGKKYEYKATANGNWDDFVLPAGDNANFVFGTNEYPAGTYTLTFTANVEENTLTLVAEQQGVEPQPEVLTIAQAIALIDENQGAKVENVSVEGIISQIDSFNSKYGSITYWISADGSTEGQQFEVYSGLNIGGEKFTSKDDIEVGAKVVVTGDVKKYNDVYEFDFNNQIVSYEAPEPVAGIESMAINGTFPGMSWDADKGIAMTQDADNKAVWTLTMERVVVEGQKYEYKAFANGETTGYQLPAEGNNDFVFGTDMYPAGTYTLTFTANTSTHKLTLEANKPIETIKELNAQADGKEFSFAGNAIVVAKAVRGGAYDATNNNVTWVYVKDETGNSLIYDGHNGSKLSLIDRGNVITAPWAGTVKIFNNLFEVEPETTLESKSSVQVEIPEGTPGDVKAENVNKVVEIKGLTIDNVDGQKIKFTIGDATVAGYNQFQTPLPEVTEGKTFDVVGAIGIYGENAQFWPMTFTEVKKQQFSVGFTTDKKWENVYAYTWSGDNVTAAKVEQLGQWPGKEMEVSDAGYVVTIEAAEAPDSIIFNNGTEAEVKEQTGDLPFVNGTTYTFSEEKATAWAGDPDVAIEETGIIIPAKAFAKDEVQAEKIIHIVAKEISTAAPAKGFNSDVAEFQASDILILKNDGTNEELVPASAIEVVDDGYQFKADFAIVEEVTKNGLIVKPANDKKIGIEYVEVEKAKAPEPVAEDINITPEAGADIAEALATAKAAVAKVGNITINLTADANYTVSAPIVAPANVVINGNGATVDASALAGNFIEMAVVDAPTEWTEANVTVKELTVKGLKKALFYSACKNYFGDVTVDKCVVEQAADATTFDYTKGSTAVNFTVTNSTFYAPTATTKSFYSSQAGQKTTEYNAEAVQTFTFTNNTMYNLASGKNFFTHRQANQKWMAYNVKNNIFVNCGKSGQVIKGLNGGSGGANPTWNVDGNAFNFEGADTSANEETGDADEPVKNSLAGVFTFTDAAAGDFNGVFKSEAAEAPAKYPGDPRWTYTYESTAPAKFYLIGSMNNWDRTALTEMTFNETTQAYEYEYAPTEKVWFAFADKQLTAEEATADPEWADFNANHRYAIGAGDVNATLNEAIALQKVNGTLVLEAGSYKISVAKDLSTVTITGEAPETTYTVAGSFYYADGSVAIFGTEWDVANTANDMEKQLDGTYKKVYTIDFPFAGNIQFKVAENHAWDVSYGWDVTAENPDGNAFYAVASPANGATVTITFDPNGATAADKVKIEVTGIPTVGINGIVTDDADDNAPIYNLAGQKVDKNYKGVVIKNGKKIYQK